MVRYRASRSHCAACRSTPLVTVFASTGRSVDLFLPGLDIASTVPERRCKRELALPRRRALLRRLVLLERTVGRGGMSALLLGERPSLTQALSHGLPVASAKLGPGRSPLSDVVEVLDVSLWRYRLWHQATRRPSGPPTPTPQATAGRPPPGGRWLM